MATKKSTTVVDKENKIDIPQDITKCLFFQRLPYRLTEEQWNFIKAVWNKKNIGVFVNARAGSSKTTLAVGMAMLMAYEYKMYKNIYYIISPCEEDKLGFVPGSIEDKSAMYMEPLRQALVNWGFDPDKCIASDTNMDNVKNGEAIIRAIPHTFLRGYDIDNAIVICEEAQNYRLHDLKKTLTRIHDDCKAIIIGHDGQVDLKYPADSGFIKYLMAGKNQEFIEVVELTENFRGKLSNWADEVR